MGAGQPSIFAVLGIQPAGGAPNLAVASPSAATAGASTAGASTAGASTQGANGAQPSIFDVLGIQPAAKTKTAAPAISMPTKQPKAATAPAAPQDVPTAENLARKPPMAGVQEQPPIWKTDVATAAKEVSTAGADILGSLGDVEHMATGAVDKLTGHAPEGTLFPTSETLGKVFDNAWVNKYAASGATTAGHVLGMGVALAPAAPLIGAKAVQAAKSLAGHAGNVVEAARFLSKPEQVAAAQAAQKVQVDAANRLASLEQTATTTADNFAKESANRVARISKIAPEVEARTAAGVQKAALQRGASTEELGQNMREALLARKQTIEDARAAQWQSDQATAKQAATEREATGHTLGKVPEFQNLRAKLKNEQQSLASGDPMAAKLQNVRMQLSGRTIPMGEQEQAALDQGLSADIPSKTPMTVDQLYSLRRQMADQIDPRAEGYSARWSARAKDLVDEIDSVLSKHTPEYNTARKNYANNSRPLDAFEAKPGVAATKTVSPYGTDIHSTEAKYIPSRAFSSKESVSHLVDALGHTPEEKAAAKEMVNTYARTHFTDQLAGKSSTQIRDYLTKNREVMQATDTYSPFSKYADKLQKIEGWAKDRETLADNLAKELGKEESAKTGSLAAQSAAARKAAQSFKGTRMVIQSAEPDKAVNAAMSWANSAVKDGTLPTAEYQDVIKRIQSADAVFAHTKDVQMLRRTLKAAVGVGFVGYALHRIQFNFLSNMTR